MTACAPEGRAGRWYAVALHSHSRYSDGNRTVAQLIEMARKAGLDALTISDHNTLRQTEDAAYKSNGLVLIPGMEWTCPRGPHAGLHGISGVRPVDPTLRAPDLYAVARERGATVVINHPGDPHYTWTEDDLSGAGAVEIWNFVWGIQSGTSLKARLRPVPWQQKRHGLRYTVASLHAMVWDKNPAGIAFWQRALESGHRLAPVAASDFHSAPQKLESPCTLLWAEDGSQEALLAAIRAGRTIATTRPDGARALLEADGDGDGRFERMAGESATPGAKLRLHVTGAKGATARIYGPGGMKRRFRVSTGDWSTVFEHPGGPFVWARVDGALPGQLKAVAAPIYFG
jgi:hypothetical protein